VEHHRGDFNKANVHPRKVKTLKPYFNSFNQGLSA